MTKGVIEDQIGGAVREALDATSSASRSPSCRCRSTRSSPRSTRAALTDEPAPTR